MPLYDTQAQPCPFYKRGTLTRCGSTNRKYTLAHMQASQRCTDCGHEVHVDVNRSVIRKEWTVVTMREWWEKVYG